MKTTKIDWHTVMVRKLQLGGKSERTVQAYTRAVHQLTTHYKKDPEFITEEELEAYFLSFGYSPDLPGERWVDWTGLKE